MQANELALPVSLLAGLLLVLYLFLYYLSRKNKSVHLNNLAGITGMLLLAAAGYLVTHTFTSRQQPVNLAPSNDAISHYVGVVDDYITQKPTSVSSIIQVKAVKRAGTWQPAAGKVRLTIKRAQEIMPFRYGAVLLVKGAPEPVKPPLNPAQFDYRRYLANSQVYYQQYLPGPWFIQVGYEPGNRLKAWSIGVRNYLDDRLRAAMPSEREYGVAAALLLGIKDFLPEDIKAAYSQSGTMHVLAVSGLHVGVIFYVLNLLLGKWSRQRGFKWFRFLVLLGIFGSYAFVTALSASVLRAVGMFLLLVAAETFRRQTNIYNTLAAAAFFLLLYNPYFLIEVGFQLSFLAVLGILYFSPIFESWLAPETYVARFLWKMLCASVAAQLTTLPLTLYYFHQFPVYFLAANVVAITVSSGALVVGLLLLALSWLPMVPVFLGWVLTGLLRFMHESNAWLLQAPFPVIEGISLTTLQTWVLYGLLGLLGLFFARKKLIYFSLFAGVFLLFSSLKIKATNQRQANQLLVVYQVPRATALAFISGHQGQLLADSAFYTNPKNHQYIIQPHWQELGLTVTHTDTLGKKIPETIPAMQLPDGNQLLQWQGVKILLCRRPLDAQTLQKVKPTYLLVSNRPYLAVDALAPALKNTTVILDGTNSRPYQQRVEQKLTKAGINCYNLNKSGALVQLLPLKN
ncbi:ComEC/Rec2 family competence protein [Adhaeribacter aerolatus]|uniref:ComEC/Rec2 family competence protein n=1 Tax=Adhaeribacter aerolatus TaxID=670289 RepID=UPI001478EC84|nr:ComEC/Rec2 family competence protein [Adhaeribacter aerolatus]